MKTDSIKGPKTWCTLPQLQLLKRDITNKRFKSDGYYGAIDDIISDIKYLKHQQKNKNENNPN